MNAWKTHDWVDEKDGVIHIRRYMRCRVCGVYGIEGLHMWSFDGSAIIVYGYDCSGLMPGLDTNAEKYSKLVTCEEMCIREIIK